MREISHHKCLFKTKKLKENKNNKIYICEKSRFFFDKTFLKHRKSFFLSLFNLFRKLKNERENKLERKRGRERYKKVDQKLN